MGSFLFTQLLKYKCKKNLKKRRKRKRKKKKEVKKTVLMVMGSFFWSNVIPYWPMRRIYP